MDPREALSRVFDDLRKERYRPSVEEIELGQRCQSMARKHGVEAFLATGSILWSVTGKLKLMERLIASFVGAASGTLMALRWSVDRCIEHYLALEGSPLQEKLVGIMQKEAVHNPRTRSFLEKLYHLEPLYDDSDQETSGFLLRKREIRGVSLEKPSGQVDWYVKGPDDLDDNPKVNPKEVSETTPTKGFIDDSQGHGSNQSVVHDDVFGLWWSETEESNKRSVDRKDFVKHRSRMGVLERRAYNRARYLEWQEKRNASKSENDQAEL